MSITLAGRKIDRVLILDDQPSARQAMRLALEEAGVEPVVEDGPIVLDSLLKHASSSGDAVFSDYRLTPGNYAKVQGDKLVASCVKKKIPALLCTTYSDIDIMINRQLIRYIPVVLRTQSPGPDEIVDSFKICLSEMFGKTLPSRRPWKTLVRIEEIETDRNYCYVVVPAWDVETKIRISIESIPSRIRRHLKPDQRLRALVNIGAESQQDLFFDQWEAA
jgi:CheY-like chemotaxis protein